MSCVKRYFLTKEEAVKSIEKIHAKDKSKHKKPIRSYRCDKCGKFHLTSMTKKQKQRVENKPLIIKQKQLEKQIEYVVKKNGWDEELSVRVPIKKKAHKYND